MSNQLFGLAGWYLLPNLVTGYIQTALYAILIRAGEPKPAPGTPRFVRDRRRIQICVIVVYLLYTLYEADYQLRREGDFYQLLGVPHDVEERALQSRFRRVTVQHHPDKASGTESLYIQLKLARDTLVDPTRRFAYDRLGPSTLTWQHCEILRDYVLHGIQQQTTYYVGSASALLLLGVLGYLQQGKFWRYLVMAALFGVEMHTMTMPHFPLFLTRVLNPILVATEWRPPYLPYQMLALLRKLAVTFFIALSQLSPLLQQGSQQGAAGKSGDAIQPQLLNGLDGLTSAIDQEVSRLLALEFAPFAGDGTAMKGLRTGVKEWLVQNTIRNEPGIREATENVLARRRGGGVGRDRTPP